MDWWWWEDELGEVGEEDKACLVEDS